MHYRLRSERSPTSCETRLVTSPRRLSVGSTSSSTTTTSRTPPRGCATSTIALRRAMRSRHSGRNRNSRHGSALQPVPRRSWMHFCQASPCLLPPSIWRPSFSVRLAASASRWSGPRRTSQQFATSCSAHSYRRLTALQHMCQASLQPLPWHQHRPTIPNCKRWSPQSPRTSHSRQPSLAATPLTSMQRVR